MVIVSMASDQILIPPALVLIERFGYLITDCESVLSFPKRNIRSPFTEMAIECWLSMITILDGF